MANYVVLSDILARPSTGNYYERGAAVADTAIFTDYGNPPTRLTTEGAIVLSTSPLAAPAVAQAAFVAAIRAKLPY